MDRPNEVIREVVIPSSGLAEKVQGKLTCKQSGKGGFLYMLQCTKSQAAYLGESGRQEPVHRFSEHRRSVENRDETKAVGKHFLDNNAGSEDIKFVPFIAVKSGDPFARKFLERQLILKHNLLESDLGININL